MNSEGTFDAYAPGVRIHTHTPKKINIRYLENVDIGRTYFLFQNKVL